jgi:hypothetical protein
MSNVKTKTTKQAKVLNALKEGKALTSADIRNRYKAGNPQAVIQALRFAGNPIYLNEVKSSTGRKSMKYRLGTPSKAIIAAGYRAMANKQISL